MSLIIECHGKRMTLKTAPMAKLRSLIPEALQQAGLAPEVDPASCTLQHNGKPLDLELPMRFANLPSGAKVELRTGREPVLGIQEKRPHGRAVPASAASTSDALPPPLPPQAAAAAATAEPAAPLVAPLQPAAPPTALPKFTPGSQAAPEPSGIVGPSHPSHAIFGRVVHLFTREAEAERDAAQIPAAAAAGALDESAYEVTEADLRAVMAGYAARRAQEQRGMMTKQMREAEEGRLAGAYGPVPVRVELPDGNVLQSSFAATAPLEELSAVVARALTPAAAAAFHLFTAPPKVVLRDMAATFYASRLVPAARVHVGFAEAVEGPLLRPEVAQLLGEPPVRAQAMRSQEARNGNGTRAAAAGASSGPELAEGTSRGGATGQQSVNRPGAASGAGPKWMKIGR